MKLNDNGNIQFDYRSEVDHVSVALQEWLREHENDSKAEDVRNLIGKLESMYMSW